MSCVLFLPRVMNFLYACGKLCLSQVVCGLILAPVLQSQYAFMQLYAHTRPFLPALGQCQPVHIYGVMLDTGDKGIAKCH